MSIAKQRPPAEALPIPSGPEELGVEWMQAVLHAAGCEGEIDNIRWHRIGATKGIGGRVVRVQLARGSEHDSLVVKFDNRGPGTEPAEVRFYRELAETTPLSTPDCVYAGANLESGASVIVMEDLAHLRPCSDLRGLRWADAAAVVRHLARFHARFWGTVDDEVPWVRDYRVLTKELTQWFRENRAASVAQLEGTLGGELARVCRRLVGNEEPILDLLAQSPRTLAHLDFRADNIFLDKERRPFVVDFQSISRQRGAADLGRFIGTSMPHDVRRKHVTELIDLYADTLRAAAVRYGRDELERDVRLGLLHWLVYALGLLPDPILSNGRLRRVVETWIERLAAAVTELDAFAALA